MAFELNPQQNNAVKVATKWFKDQNEIKLEISGPAGSGKSTIVSELVNGIGLKQDEVMYMAYVGKAAQSLAMKGHDARTIHSSIYKMTYIPKYGFDGKPMYDEHDRPILKRTFVKVEALPKNKKLLVVDEGGQVNVPMAQDILSFNISTLVLGDLNQLPPVFGISGFMRDPDIVLTQVMRQAEDSEIVYLSQQILKGKKLEYGKYNNSIIMPYSDVTDKHLTSVESIICGRNRTRDDINSYLRNNIYKFNPREPVHVGEKLICRKNDWGLSIGDNIYLINGMVGYVREVYLESFTGKSIEIDFQPDFTDEYFKRLRIDIEYLHKPAVEESNTLGSNAMLQHGYAISGYLSQGSQYDSVFYHRDVYNKKKFQKALDYTIITRAINHIYIAM